MTIIPINYLDASVIVKLALDERHSVKIRKYIESHSTSVVGGVVNIRNPFDQAS
jgi:hypothetical protein